MYDAEDFDQIQTAEFREAFNEFDKVFISSFWLRQESNKWSFSFQTLKPNISVSYTIYMIDIAYSSFRLTP